MSKIPSNWQVKSLGEVASVKTGYPFNLKLFSEVEGFPIIRIRDIKRGATSTYYKGEILQDYIIRKGNYLIGMDGEFNLAEWKSEEALLNQRACKIIFDDRIINPKYGFYFIPKKLKEIEDSTSFATVKHISHKQILKIQIPLPPLPIQKQIAEILEKADKAKYKRKEAKKLTDEFLQSLFIEMFGDPVKNPKGWKKISFGEIISTLMDYHSNGSYATLRKNVKLLDHPDYAYMVRTTDLEKKDYTTNVKYISKNSFEFLSKSQIFGGEIIMNKIGSAGQVYFMPYLNRKVSLGMNQFGLRFNDRVNNLFIYYLLKSSYGKAIINKKVQDAVTKTITKEAVRSLIIPLPPLSLQQQFVEIVNKTEALKEKQKQSEQELENLFQSLMQRAFKGELVC